MEDIKYICVYGASSAALDEAYYRAAYQLGIKIAQAGYGLVYGGGNMGIMGSCARGVHNAYGRVVGVLPHFMAEVVGVPYSACDDMITVDTMRERKQVMEDMASAFITAPGGIGTFEEFMEILTLKQLKQHKKALVLLNTLSYYDRLVNALEYSVDEKFSSRTMMSLYTVAETPKDAIDQILNYQYEEFADKWHDKKG